jgi:hypothetical protein
LDLNAKTTQVNSAFIHLNSLAISDEDVFTISRAIPLSSIPKILDLYGNSIQVKGIERGREGEGVRGREMECACSWSRLSTFDREVPWFPEKS